VQPVIGESLMTCWIAMEPGAVVAEHSHPNEQLGVVVEGSVSITAKGKRGRWWSGTPTLCRRI
jgi:quercetin dioxygenase-like cupin family protein